MSEVRHPPWWAELSLVAVHLVVVGSFSRLYLDHGYLAPLLVVVLTAHALTALCRRFRLAVVPTTLVAIVGLVVVTCATLLGATTWFGIPTGESWAAGADSLVVARQSFGQVVAPTEVTLGFQIASAFALWLAVWIADWTAFRMQAIVEPVAPATVVFVFCSVLGSGTAPVAWAAAFGAAAVIFVGCQRATVLHPGHAVGALARASVAVAAVSVAAATLVVPIIPGSSSDALISWPDGGGNPSRVTISPMVELKRRLVEQEASLAFTVRSSRPSYWRLTALDVFDGDIWTSSGEFSHAGQDLGRDVPPLDASSKVSQSFEIEGLSTIWAPAAFQPVSMVSSNEPLRWDPSSATLIIETGRDTSDGLRYSVVSSVPSLDAARLEADGGRDPEEIVSRFTDLPEGFPLLAVADARRATAGATSRYDKALALQNWFRNDFEYSLDAPAGHGDDALVAFLQDRVGYCEQFAGAYAAMARSLGIPARVAVGFTPGDVDPSDPDLYRVRGRHAHAWPEVYFSDVGWVAFEPTPQRGIPGAQNYTGIPAQQAGINGAPEAPATTTTPTTGLTSTPVTGDTAPTTTADATAVDATGPATAEGVSTWSKVAMVAAGGCVALISTMGLLRRRVRRAKAALAALTPADRAWTHVGAHLEESRLVHQRAAETPSEFARRVADDLGDNAPMLEDLARLVDRSRWSTEGLSEADQHEVERLADELIGADRPPEG